MTEPLFDKASNFTRTLPMLGLLLILTIEHSLLSVNGFWLAALAGILTSAVGGIVFANEELTVRLLIATGLIISGILWVVVSRGKFSKD